jgi:glycosyltransferase involved in cell wall biosynthesis
MDATFADSTLLEERPPIRLAVDMTNLRPGGENGGIKPFLFETLLWLGRQQQTPLQFLYLTRASTHAEVCAQLARMHDEVICVLADSSPLPKGNERVPRQRLYVPPPADLLRLLRARVLYCPFGPVEFALPGIGTISTVVDVLHRDFPWSLSPAENATREKVFEEIVAVADRLQCISHHVAARMREHYDFPSERIFTSHIAVHQRFATMSPVPGDAPAQLRKVGRVATPFFFYPANSWRHKNHETLLLAYGIYRAGALAAGTIPWRLVLSGHEDERWRAMRALAGTLNILGEEAVEFRGYVPPAEFGRLWETAGALVFPSLHEGFGIPLLEAMQHYVPVLTSREGSLPEVGAEACLYADVRSPQALASAMTQMATDSELRRALVTAGRRRLVDFSLDRESAPLLQAIVELSRATPPYRRQHRGIAVDGWTEPLAMLALPDPLPGDSRPARLSLRFHAMPVARRVRLRAGVSTVLGSFDLPSYHPDHEIAVDFRAGESTLWIEVPDAANISPSDGRIHGVRLHDVDFRMADGRDYQLFSA